jgi:hypothetical protein
LNGKEKYNEKDLLLQVSEGNENAFRQLFDTYRSKLGRLLTQKLKERLIQSVEDSKLL